MQSSQECDMKRIGESKNTYGAKSGIIKEDYKRFAHVVSCQNM
jgi:hypothetical protein